jgi:hypothetical protein
MLQCDLKHFCLKKTVLRGGVIQEVNVGRILSEVRILCIADTGLVINELLNGAF